MMDKISYIKTPYCQKVLPLVYDDSLSYYEAICKFVKKVNELVDALNNVTVDILDQAKSYTDEKVAESLAEVDERIFVVNQLIEQTQRNFDEALNALQRQYATFSSGVSAQLTLFDGKINTFDRKIDDSIIGVNARTDLAIEQNNEYIFDVIGSQVLSDIKVRNFFTGDLVGVQDMFDYLANLHVDDGINYSEIVTRNKTVNQMVAYNKDITDFVLHGNTIIV